MWEQTIDPLNNMLLSTISASLPLIVMLVLLAKARMPGYKAAFISSILCILVALIVYRAPVEIIVSSYLYGVLFALWPISWIIVNALVLYEVSRELGLMESFEKWILNNVPRDPVVQALFIAFVFGALIEGIDGYGFPIAVASTILVSMGFDPFKAVIISLLANTITVPFASLGVPIATLSLVSGLELGRLAIISSFQLLFISIIIPFMIAYVVEEKISLEKIDSILLPGLLLGFSVLLASIYVGAYLTGIVAPLVSMALLIVYYRVRYRVRGEAIEYRRSYLLGWIPWIIVVVLMMLTGLFKLYKLFALSIEIPMLHNVVYSSLYNDFLSAKYTWSPLHHGTMVFATIIIVVAIFSKNNRVGMLYSVYSRVLKRFSLAIITIAEVVGIAFLMKYVGLSMTLGYALSMLRNIYPIASAFIGWIGTFITGSSTGSNALFGLLQRITAEIIDLPPYLVTAVNSTAGVIGKMISLQSIAIGVSAVGLIGREGDVLKKLFLKSIILLIILVFIIYVQLLLGIMIE